MGAGASAKVSSTVSTSSVEELTAQLTELSDAERARLAGILTDVLEGPPEIKEMDMSEVLNDVFRCFDMDQDGLIEREEYLDCCNKIADILDESFGVKQRKEKMTWYRDAGADGTPTEGMTLSRDIWEIAFLKTASDTSEIPGDAPRKLAGWIWNQYGQKLLNVCYPPAKPDLVSGILDVPSGPPPTYPLKIPLTDLAKHMDEAKSWGLRTLVLSGGLDEVDVYMKYTYPGTNTLDSTAAFMKKKEELRSTLKHCMEYMGLASSLHISMASTEFDWVKFCCDDFPADIFSGASWTVSEAFDKGFITETMKGKADMEPTVWKEFNIVISSHLDLETAKAKLGDKIPHFDKLAILEIDPNSVAK